MSELLDKKWPVVIKGNAFTNSISGLFGVFFLVLGGLSLAFGYYCMSKNSWEGALVALFIAFIFLAVAYRFITEIINSTTHFRIAADEKGLCLMMSGKYVSIPYESITSIWAGEPYIPVRGGSGVSLVIILKKSFSPYNNFIMSYFFELGGHKIRYSQLELGMTPFEARDLLKTYWKEE
jgi:hypothetical protein